MKKPTQDELVSIVAYLLGSAALTDQEAPAITALHFVGAGMRILEIVAQETDDDFAQANLKTIEQRIQQVLGDPAALSEYLHCIAKEFAKEVANRRQVAAGSGLPSDRATESPTEPPTS